MGGRDFRHTASRHRVKLGLNGRYAHKPHVKMVLRVELDVAHMGFVCVVPIQPDFDATARGSGTAKTRRVSELSDLSDAAMSASEQAWG